MKQKKTSSQHSYGNKPTSNSNAFGDLEGDQKRLLQQLQKKIKVERHVHGGKDKNFESQQDDVDQSQKSIEIDDGISLSGNSQPEIVDIHENIITITSGYSDTSTDAIDTSVNAIDTVIEANQPYSATQGQGRIHGHQSKVGLLLSHLKLC